MAMPIDPNEDSRVYIFDHVIFCRFPHLATLSTDYIKHFGTPTTGNPQIDQNIASQWITSYISIAKMIEYHKQGVPIKVPKQEDVVFIYDAITNHLQKWKKEIEWGINVSDAPIEDLIAMDQFAMTVYDQAKHQFTREIASSLLLRHMSSTMKINKSNFFREAPAEQPIITFDEKGYSHTNIKEEPDPFPKRESMSDIFKDRKIGKWK